MQKLITLLVLGLALHSCAQKRDLIIAQNLVENNNSIFKQQIDEMLKYYESQNKFNGSVLVSKDHNIILENGYGYQNFEENKLNTHNSIFQIYSITKTFTSTMIFKLIEEKKLALDDKLIKFYPDFPNAENITIEHLLTHTAGLNDDSDGSGENTEAYRLKLFASNKPNFAPGEGWAYSNAGYQLLGYIISKVAGTSYEDAIRKNIFQPLGMHDSGFNFKGLSNINKTCGYTEYQMNNKIQAALHDSLGPYSAGAIYSTVDDLYKFYMGIQENKIITSESKTMAFLPSKRNKNYAHGWQIENDFMQDTMVFHGGGYLGYRTIFVMVPRRKIFITILQNNQNGNPEFFVKKIREILDGKAFSPPKEISMDSLELEKYIGTFRIDEPKLIVVTSILGGKLAINVGGQGLTSLIHVGKNDFFQEEADAHLSFMADKDGQIVEIQVQQGQRIMKAKKIIPSWGVIGSVTENGWEDKFPDLQMIEDLSVKGLWKLPGILLKSGDFKFRKNSDWSLNYGSKNGSEKLELNGNNIHTEAGKYTITLDLTDKTNPIYMLEKSP